LRLTRLLGLYWHRQAHPTGADIRRRRGA